MAIYDHQYGGLSYFRVFRAWGGKEYQEYIRIKRSRKAAYTKAQEIDARLEKAQKAFSVRQALSADYHIRSNGQIRGLRRITVKRKDRLPSEVFELRINVPWESEIRRTTISISVHGEEKAFALSTEKICEWYGLASCSEVNLAMQDCYPCYKTKHETRAPVTSLVIKKAKNEFSNLAGGFMKGLKRFTG